MCSLIFFYYSNIIYQFYITCMSLSCIIFYGSIISQNLSVFIVMDRRRCIFFTSTMHCFGQFFGRSFGLSGLRTIELLGIRSIGPSDYQVDTVQVVQTDCQLIKRAGYIDNRQTKVSANGQKNEQKLRRMYTIETDQFLFLAM